MKILMVAIPNHHFFQWANQLKESGYEVHWFDITDGAGFSNKINWVTQYAGWKLRWNFPFRHRVKKQFPSLYQSIQSINERSVSSTFNRLVTNLQPDVIHVFEMQLSGHPIFSVLEQHANIPLIYSSWGSDMFQYDRLGLTTSFVKQFLNRVDYLITDCNRDYVKALQLGFKNKFLGVFPGNGGVAFIKEAILAPSDRTIIMVKGYEDGVGKALVVLRAIAEFAPQVLEHYKLIVYSADEIVVKYLKTSVFYQKNNVTVFSRATYIPNHQLLTYMGQSSLHIANSISDGMPNVVLEAMGMGAFPIQSNPGNVTEEVITHRKNGLLIESPLDEQEIARLIIMALDDFAMRESAQEYNTAYMHQQYDRLQLKAKIVALYSQIYN
jgi:glycosyltransferase involved in cell wall biosynthesis